MQGMQNRVTANGTLGFGRSTGPNGIESTNKLSNESSINREEWAIAIQESSKGCIQFGFFKKLSDHRVSACAFLFESVRPRKAAMWLQSR
jgi:hypothetical protein